MDINIKEICTKTEEEVKQISKGCIRFVVCMCAVRCEYASERL